MPLPQVAIVGRPNVGKSSLLNRLAGRRVSIVEPTAGVTRDRVSAEVEWEGRRFQLVDTGGLGLVDENKLKDHIESQIQVAIEGADLIVFVVDCKEGSVPGDQLVARKLRRLEKDILLVVNKVESHYEELEIHVWDRLGFGEPLAVSAKEGFGTSDLKSAIVERLPEATEEELGEEPLKFAVVGKRNSGKSTFVNELCGEQRVIVSEIPGTTRDSVDVVFEHEGQRMVAIDTAGVRKKSRVQDAIELFSYTRATESIRRADLVIHMFEIGASISQVDKKVAHYCAEHSKPVVLVGNKVDLARIELEKWDKYIRQQLPGLRYAPVVFISALEGFGVDETLDLLFELQRQSCLEVSTSKLNEVLHDAKVRLSPKSYSKKPKIFYATQRGTMPLTFIVFVNEPSLFRGQYERYLANLLRQEFDVPEVPIKLVFRKRERSEPGGPGAGLGAHEAPPGEV